MPTGLKFRSEWSELCGLPIKRLYSEWEGQNLRSFRKEEEEEEEEGKERGVKIESTNVSR